MGETEGPAAGTGAVHGGNPPVSLFLPPTAKISSVVEWRNYRGFGPFFVPSQSQSPVYPLACIA